MEGEVINYLIGQRTCLRLNVKIMMDVQMSRVRGILIPPYARMVMTCPFLHSHLFVSQRIPKLQGYHDDATSLTRLGCIQG
jgi:hypothetical protein